MRRALRLPCGKLWVIINWAGNAMQALVGALVIYMNWKMLPKAIKPSPTIIFLNVLWAVIVFLFFLAWTIFDNPLSIKL